MGIWISALANAIESDLPTNKTGAAYPKDILNWLSARSRDGKLFKPAELEWSGLVDWLDLQQGLVTKVQLQNYLSTNGVQVNEVILGNQNDIDITDPDTIPSDLQDLLDKFENGDFQLKTLVKKSKNIGYELIIGMDGEVEDVVRIGQLNEPAKYNRHTVKGGENYKELLLTLSDKEETIDFKPLEKLPDNFNVLFDRTQPKGKQYSVAPAEQIHGMPYGGWRASTSEEAISGALEILNSELENKARDLARHNKVAKQFKSSHFDHENILAHVRFDERSDADGNKILFIQEIQSDWGQTGKKSGFIERYKAEDIVSISPLDQEASQPDLFWYFKVPNNTLQIPKSIYLTEKEALDYVLSEKQTISGATTPKAPFVTKTDAWVGLALKRMMKYAVENSFDKVAFISGEQAADLYDLSKQIGYLNLNEPSKINQGDSNLYRNYSGKKYILEGYKSADSLNAIITKDFNDLSELESIIGKDAAKLIIDRVNSNSYAGLVELRGEQLAIGGNGMKAFYNSIVPKVAKDILKKLAGEEIISIKIESELGSVANTDMNQLGFNITPKLMASVSNGVPLFSLESKPVAEMLSSSNDLSHDELHNEIQRLKRHWQKMPPVTVVNTVAELPFHAPNHASGAFLDGHVYIVADNITSVGHLQKVMAHECVMHYSLQEMLGEYGFAKMSNGIQQLKADGDPIINELASVVNSRYGKLDPMEEVSEMVALAGERCVDGNGNIKIGYGFMKNIYAGIASWLRDAGVKVPFSNFELQGIMHAAGQWIRQDLNRESKHNFIGQPAFRLDDLSSPTDSFNKWFDGSKVIDEEGKPLIVYHGTRGRDVTTFNVPDTGTYFTTNLEAAESYGEVIPAYLNISNPMILDFEGESDMGDEWNIEEEVAFAKESGYDGLIVRNSFDGENYLDQYVVFKPNQIKAAIGNNLGFNPDNPNIYYSLNTPDFPSKGSFSGKILKIEGNVITQKINRAGEFVKHLVDHVVSKTLREDEVVNIQYENGVPVLMESRENMISR
ncbi:hypothetical protein [Methylotenera sp.]|uniref:ADP-ribosyltransferase-containing protein n=1 Tax=Methylotenera sp. TaxID=2051956 RepID=UPI002ED79686